MTYKVLYRKYRPSNFGEMVGQENSVRLIRESIISNKLSHAYIFSGPRGTGKTSSAKIFAKTVNCLNPVNGSPCEECENCKNFAENSDIYEIDAASNNGVDQIREIVDNIKLAPINSKYKVYIIDEVHMLSVSAFNALLLTLEEPPSHVIFILATTNIEQVPITVLSRCQRIDFRKINTKDIIEKLSDISKKEGIIISEGALKEIADYAEGGLRDALSILDQLSKENEEITEESVLKALGAISTTEIERLVNCIEDGDIEVVTKFVEKLRENSIDIKTFIKKLLKEIKKRAIEIKKNKYSSKLTYSDYKELSFELANIIFKNNINIDIYSLIELILLEKISCGKTVEKSNQVKDIKKTVKQVSNKAEITPAPQVSEHRKKLSNKENKINDDIIDIRLNNCFAEASKMKKMSLVEKWQNFLNTMEDMKIRGMLADTNIVLASEKIIVLTADIISNVNNINQNCDRICELYSKYSGENYTFCCITASRWITEMEMYKNNIKSGYKYELKNEPDKNEENNVEIDNIFSNIEVEVV